MPPGRLWSVAGRQVISTFGSPRVSSTSSRARAPQPTTRTRGDVTPSGDARTPLVDQPPRHVRGHARVAAVRVRADRGPELLVQRRATDQHDVVVPHPA